MSGGRKGNFPEPHSTTSGASGPEGKATGITDGRHPTGTTTQRPRPPPRLRRNICALLAGPFRSQHYPESKNGRFNRIVKTTLKTTLTAIQNKHPGPIRRNGNRLVRVPETIRTRPGGSACMSWRP
jgi:hypothetical protein